MLDSPVEIDGNVRIAEGSGLAARPRSEQISKLYPFILFKNGGQVLMVSLSNHIVFHGLNYFYPILAAYVKALMVRS